MLIYRQYNQASLDEQYNNRLHVPGFASYFNRWEILSRETEKKYTCIRNISYGKGAAQILDVYPAAEPMSKTLIFIHGGYWQTMDKASFHFIAGGFRPYGITTVLLTYPLAPSVSMDEIVLSCREAVDWLYRNIPAYNGDPEQLFVAGYSAGGHLAVMLMATNWNHFNKNLAAGIIKGACTISGLFNLIPIQLSNLNQVLKMDMEMALRNSPVQLQPLNECPVILAAGGDETSEFKDQSREFYNCWQPAGIPMQLLEIPGLNHFSILETLPEPASVLHEAMCRLMGI
jgi:arylformamidase